MGARTGGAPATLEVEVRPPSPFRIGRGSTDRTLRVERGIATRLLRGECRPGPLRAWPPGTDQAPRRGGRPGAADRADRLRRARLGAARGAGDGDRAAALRARRRRG